ncbi:MAG: hypothetical protein WA004_05070 [Saprospiraceae bacterium]
MLNYAGREIYCTEQVFNPFSSDVEQFGDMATPHWWRDHWWELLSKRMILKSTVELIYQEEGESIELKEVVKRFRAYEKSIWNMVKQVGVDVLESQVNGDNGFTPEKLEPIISGLSADDKRKLGLHTAYTSFINFYREKTRWANKDEGYGFIPPSKIGTVYSWLVDNERSDFFNYLNDKKKDVVFGQGGITWGITPEFSEVLSPDLEDIIEYVSIIDEIVKKVMVEKSFS